MAAMKWRHELDKWLKDEQKNIFEMKIVSQKGRGMELSILDLVKFNLELNSDANVTSVASTEEDLQGFWLQKMQEFITNNPKNTLAQFLDTATQVYSDKDPDVAMTPSASQEDKFKDQEDMFDGEETPFTAVGVTDAFDDLALEPPSAQVAKAKQSEMVKQHLVEQVQNTINNLVIGDTIKQMQGAAQKDFSKKADRIMYARFYTDGVFTIDDGPPRLMSDPAEKQILEAFGKGFVPPEYAKNAKDIDLHVIWESYKYSEYQEVQKQKQQADKMQVDEIEDEILEQIKQQSLLEAMEREKQHTPAVKPAPSQGKPLGTNAPTPAPVQAKPTPAPQPVAQPKPTPAPVAQKPVEKFKYTPNMNAPTTTIQFKFEDGAKLKQVFNTTDTVEILYKFIASADNAPANFVLVNIPKQLTDKSADLKSQGLENASILVKKI